MPLLDHFHGPIADTRVWESFHGRWAVAIGNDLNARLPERFVAEVPIRLGPSVEADVAEHEQIAPGGPAGEDELAAVAYDPPAATASLPAEFPLGFAVEVRDHDRDRRLVAAIELVSPGNKDRPETREWFAAKMAGYVQTGAGLVVVDIVTDKRFNLHNELVRLSEFGPELRMPDGVFTYAVAYRPVHRGGQNFADAWLFPLVVGEPLPAVPLALRGTGVTVRLDLEATYRLACEWNRIRQPS